MNEPRAPTTDDTFAVSVPGGPEIINEFEKKKNPVKDLNETKTLSNDQKGKETELLSSLTEKDRKIYNNLLTIPDDIRRFRLSAFNGDIHTLSVFLSTVKKNENKIKILEKVFTPTYGLGGDRVNGVCAESIRDKRIPIATRQRAVYHIISSLATCGGCVQIKMIVLLLGTDFQGIEWVMIMCSAIRQDMSCISGVAERMRPGDYCKTEEGDWKSLFALVKWMVDHGGQEYVGEVIRSLWRDFKITTVDDITNMVLLVADSETRLDILCSLMRMPCANAKWKTEWAMDILCLFDQVDVSEAVIDILQTDWSKASTDGRPPLWHKYLCRKRELERLSFKGWMDKQISGLDESDWLSTDSGPASWMRNHQKATATRLVPDLSNIHTQTPHPSSSKTEAKNTVSLQDVANALVDKECNIGMN